MYKKYELLHLILSCLRSGSKKAAEIAKATAKETSSVYTRLESYRLYGYMYKRQLPNKKRFIWALTEKGRERLEALDTLFAPEKTAIIDLTTSPYRDYEKVIIKNGKGKESTIELIPQPQE